MLIGQFGYGSCRHPGPFSSVLGWKITETVRTEEGSALSPEIFQQAAARCGEYAAPSAPEFATLEQLRGLPSSLRLDLVDGSVACLLKTAYAGPDYTRRDSIFGHGLLVSGVLHDQLGAVRPAELWDWNWLHPIGPDEIESAVLDPVLTEPQRQLLTPASLRPFAFDRPEILRPLLAALSSVLQRPRLIVLVEPDPAVAACWFAALEYFLPPAAAWSLPFDTYRKAAELHRSWDRLGLVAVSGGDATLLASLRDAGVPVISTVEPPVEDSIDGRPGWRGVSAEPLVADPWAMLALQVPEIDPWSQQAVFDQLDQIATALSAGGMTSPLWALTAALMSAPPALDGRLGQDCADLLIELWPTRETLPEALSRTLREQATPALREPYLTFRRRAMAAAEAGAPQSDFADMVVGGYLANSLTAELPEDQAWWLPPPTMLSPSAFQQALDALPDRLRWTEDLAAPDLRAARAVAIAGLILDSAAETNRMWEVRSSLDTAMYQHLLPILAAPAETVARFVATAPPQLARSLWDNGVRRFLSVLCARKDAPVPAEFAEYSDLVEQFRARVPGERLAPDLHEWLGSWLDPLLTAPVEPGPPSVLVLEQAAFRVTRPRDGLDLERAKLWAYLARLEYSPTTTDPARWPLTAARLTWGHDLRGISVVVGELLPRLPPRACTPELLDALLLAMPLGEAGDVLDNWRGPGEGPLYRLHAEYNRGLPVFLEPASFLQVDTAVTRVMPGLDYTGLLDPQRTSAFAESAAIWLAVHAFSFDLCSAVETLRTYGGRLDFVRLKHLLTDADYEAGWKELCRSQPQYGDRRERLMAMLHVRSLVNFREDPARNWLIWPNIEDGKRSLPALAARLRVQLEHSDQYQQEIFTTEVHSRAQRVADSADCQHEINQRFEGAKEFLRVCVQSAARLLPGSGTASKSSAPFSR